MLEDHIRRAPECRGPSNSCSFETQQFSSMISQQVDANLA